MKSEISTESRKINLICQFAYQKRDSFTVIWPKGKLGPLNKIVNRKSFILGVR